MATKADLETTQPTPATPPQDGNIAATQLREDMIETAVKFLQNPKVRQSAFAQRKLFLQKKGLTQEEIDAAIKRSGTASDETNPLPKPQPPSVPPPQPGMVVQPGALVPAVPPVVLPPPQSPWAKWRDFIAVAVIVSGATYGIIKFFKAYIGPLLQSRKEEREKLQRIEASVDELNSNISETMGELKTTLASLKEVMSEHSQQIQEMNSNSKYSTITSKSAESQAINELKSEVVSLKGLILNRHQFPAAPNPSPIPAWQRVNTTENTQTSNTTTTTTASSSGQSEMISKPPEKNTADLSAEESELNSDIVENGDVERVGKGNPQADFEGHSSPSLDVKGQNQSKVGVNGHDENEVQFNDADERALQNEQPNDLHAFKGQEVKGHRDSDDTEQQDSREDEID
ncbi:peroxisomal membrane protein PEX14-like [Ptychodera flava]|uniref:peroxisomal membrane protein PEX14-like n=1 Tax=Ptychodera flava TaxID=63121 RepID=UPI003969E9E0